MSGLRGGPVGNQWFSLDGYDERPLVQDALRRLKSLTFFGGVADYSGTPLYDGADSGRVTATDNTTAFQNLVQSAIDAGEDSVRIPAGHWGIKTGSLSFSDFGRLRIFGDGIGATILDFIKEDTSHTGAVVVDEADANFIASFSSGTSLEFQDMTVKATTKSGVVNGPAGADRVYQGAVWGFDINNVADVRFTRVRAERFNYRGFNVRGTSTERVTLLHCEGFYNTATGFWVEDADVLRIVGGEFAYNGILGEPATGYGVTGSARVGKIISEDAYYHHNYRKGLDTHGCGGFVAKNNTFENNVIFHLAAPNWEVPTGVSDVCFLIRGNKFANGEDAAGRSFLNTCYDAIVSNGYSSSILVHGGIVSITDTLPNGTRQSKIARIELNDNTVTAHYNGFGFSAFSGTTATYALELWVRDDGEVIFKNNRINLRGLEVPSSGKSDAAVPLSVPFGSLSFDGDEIIWPEDVSFTNPNYTNQTPVSITWTGNKATITFNSGHNYQDGEVVTVSGASPSGYNGTFVLAKTGTDTYTYFVSNPGAASASGTITVAVTDYSVFLLTVGVNIKARNTSFELNNARFVGSATTGRRSQSTFSGKTRIFDRCSFTYTLAPFAYIDDPYFLGSQTAGTILMSGNTYTNRSQVCKLPGPALNKTDSQITYGFTSVSKTTGQDVFYLIVDRRDRQVISIFTKDGGDPLTVNIPSSDLGTFTGGAANSTFEYSSADIFHDDDGVPKIKVTIKAKVDISASQYGVITSAGSTGSLGVERAVQL